MNVDVFNSAVTEEETLQDFSASASHCSVPLVHLQSEIIDTEPMNLLTGGTYVDTILTTLPVSPTVSILPILKPMNMRALIFIFSFALPFLGSIRGGAKYNCCDSCSSSRIIR